MNVQFLMSDFIGPKILHVAFSVVLLIGIIHTSPVPCIAVQLHLVHYSASKISHADSYDGRLLPTEPARDSAFGLCSFLLNLSIELVN